MPEFKTLKDRSLTAIRAAGMAVVYVEASSDCELLSSYLFRDLVGEFLRFEPVDEKGGRGGGGWKVVKEEVKRARDNGIIAFGLVDRDALLSSGDVEGMLETDDERLQRDHALNHHIRVLARWELENYLLLEPDLVAQAANINRPRKQPQEISSAAMLQKLLEIADVLVPVTCSRIMLHSRGSTAFTRCGDLGLSSRSRMLEAVLEHLAKTTSKSDPDQFLDEYRALETKVEAFADDQAPETAEFWRRINRIVEGKCIMKRLPPRAVGDEQHLRLLASKLYDKELIDVELQSHIDHFKNAVV